MNFQKIYNQIIERAQSEERITGTGTYYERHHIVPKCMDGDNSESNLILLTAREHFIAHKLLCEIYPDNDKLIYAYWAMMTLKKPGQERNYHIGAKEYERVRILSANRSSENQKGVPKIRIPKSETNNLNQRARKSEETKRKISETLKSKPKSEKQIQAYAANRMRNQNPWNKGLKLPPLSTETKQKISEALLQKKIHL